MIRRKAKHELSGVKTLRYLIDELLDMTRNIKKELPYVYHYRGQKDRLSIRRDAKKLLELARLYEYTARTLYPLSRREADLNNGGEKDSPDDPMSHKG